MKTDNHERKITIEKNKRFSQCAFWRMQRDYFDKEGINAWTNQVPFYITSNPYIAYTYAKIVLEFMRDWLKTHPENKNQPFYILELGTGSGRFSYYFVKTLLELLESTKRQEIKFVYIMSDFTKHNIHYWEHHPALKPYIEKGIIDFALYDMETERPIHLIRKNTPLSPELLTQPLTVFANYIFDTISHDAFTVHENKLYELLFSLHTPESNMDHNRPISMEKIDVDYHINEIKNTYYNDPHLDAIINQYKEALHATSFLIPIGSIHAVKFLKKLCHDNLMILSTDKGYNTIEQLDHLGHPTISFHGSFSMMVNFHAIASYFKNSGGDAFLQTPRKGIRTSIFTSGFKLDDLPDTKTAVIEWIEKMSPSHYFTLHSRVRDHFNEYDLDTLAAHMEFTRWDPHIYLKLSAKIASLVPTASPETIGFISKNLHQLASNYYHMPKVECVLFEIGMFFHAVKNYTLALDYYAQACPYIGEQFGLFYNMALCEYYSNNPVNALVHFKHALSLDPSSQETIEWIALTENALLKT